MSSWMSAADWKCSMADAADSAASRVLEQVSAGVAVRMGVLYQLLGGDADTDTTAGADR